MSVSLLLFLLLLLLLCWFVMCACFVHSVVA